ncbi:RNA 2'-phosphotransferase [Halovulum sp. GXIMD14793]
MPGPDDKQISKYLSLVLRHAPEKAGVTLDAQGWVSVDALLAGSTLPITRSDLDRVVRDSDKQRFAISPDGSRIRANQGHSVPVELDLEEVTPPELLYHGTVAKALEVIRAEGLKPMKRHHVHLSPDIETAQTVGARRGKPVILTILAGQMAADGLRFWRSENGVWLTDAVAAPYIRF